MKRICIEIFNEREELFAYAWLDAKTRRSKSAGTNAEALMEYLVTLYPHCFARYVSAPSAGIPSIGEVLMQRGFPHQAITRVML